MASAPERKKRPIWTDPEEIASGVTAAYYDGALIVMSYLNEKGEVQARGCFPVVNAKVGSVVWRAGTGNLCFRGIDSLYEDPEEAITTYKVANVLDAHRMEA
jgi:hypothetical protein